MKSLCDVAMRDDFSLFFKKKTIYQKMYFSNIVFGYVEGVIHACL